jgi:hypothetical protein
MKNRIVIRCYELRPRTVNADHISMNTPKLEIPSTARSSDDHLILAQPLILPPLIKRLTASHADVLEKWNRNFGLDLRWPKAVAELNHATLFAFQHPQDRH